MRIAVLSETDPIETRVAATPETIKKYKALGADEVVEAGAGVKAGVPDAEYEAAGATVAAGAAETARDADIVLKVRRPGAGELGGLKRGAIVVAIMDPYGNEAAIRALADAGVDAFGLSSVHALPRVLNQMCRGGGCEGITADPAADLGTLVQRLEKGPLRARNPVTLLGCRIRPAITRSL